jgi:hypothetical protein
MDTFFWSCAWLGSALFLLQVLLAFVGAGEGDLAVKWLSRQAVTGFLLLFGWTALGCEYQLHFSLGATLPIAAAAGGLAAGGVWLIFKGAQKLQSAGSQFRLEAVVGQKGVVYHAIRKGGVGRITVSVDQITRELDAVAEGDVEISSFVPVQVVKTTDDGKCVVVPI